MRRSLCFLGAAFALLAPVASGMHSAVACAFNGSSHAISVTMTGDGNVIILKRIGARIVVNGVPCGAATVATTARIGISGTTSHQALFLDLSGGAFIPAFPGKVRGASIKIAASLTAGTPVTIIGSAGNDNIVAGSSGIQLDSDSAVDFTIGSGLLVKMDGGAGDDRLYAGGGSGTGSPVATSLNLVGGAGNDVLMGGNANDTISDGPGNDGGLGGAGNDVFVPGPGNDSYSGGDGNDTLKATAAADGKADAFHGDAGSDTADFSARTSRVCVLVYTGFTCDGGAEDTFTDVETFIGGSGNDSMVIGSCTPTRLVGGPGNDRLIGGCGNDVLEGGPGNDQESGSTGDDIYFEGSTPNGSDDLGLVTSHQGCVMHPTQTNCNSGDDSIDVTGSNTVDYSARSADLKVTLDALQNDGAVAAAEHDNIHSGISTVRGGSGNDYLQGGVYSVTFYGGGGNDVLSGSKKQDLLHGGPGDDRYSAKDGLQDFIYTGPGNDDLSQIDVGLDAVSHAD